MSTRGSVEIGGSRYYISGDAYPSFAERHLRYATRHATTRTGIIRVANKKAGFKWIQHKIHGRFGWPFEEYRWKVNLKTGEVSQDKEYKKKFDEKSKKFNKKLKEGKIKW